MARFINVTYQSNDQFKPSEVRSFLGIDSKNYQDFIPIPHYMGIIAQENKDASLILQDCKFSTNYLTKFGVIKVVGGYLNDTNSTYWDNAGIYGGVYFSRDAAVNLIKIVAQNNFATYGGAVYLVDNSEMIIKSSTFKNNFALIRGGTIMIQRESLTSINKQIQINDTTI